MRPTDACCELPAKVFYEMLAGVSEARVRRALSRDVLSQDDFLTLLSPGAEPFLEAMAQRAHAVTLRQFGRSIQLFTPLYISNFCTNHCTYCSFAATHSFKRDHLDMAQIEGEAKRLATTGLRQILLLTGDARRKASPEYIAEAVRVVSRYFPSVGLEVYAMTTDEYRQMADAGADLLTIYQETYDKELYHNLHPKGPKSDYAFRLDAPARACEAGFRQVAVGALLGLGEPHLDTFRAATHAHQLQARYPEVEIAISMPRMREFSGDQGFTVHPVSDRFFVQALTALRLFLPRSGITISTRESAIFRRQILPLGVTRMSAGVSTAVGHDHENAIGQFEIDDPRSVAEVSQELAEAGYQPVYHDWNQKYFTA